MPDGNHLAAKSYGISEEGHIVIQAELRTRPAETFLFRGKDRRPPSTRYIIAEPDVVRKAIKKASQDLSETSNDDKPIQLQVTISNSDEDGWMLIPHDNKHRGATLDMLPHAFRGVDYEAYSFTRQRPILWRDGTKEENMFVINRPSLPSSLRKQEMWWNYPSMIFLPITVIADVATAPIQVLVYVWQANLDWN